MNDLQDWLPKASYKGKFPPWKVTFAEIRANFYAVYCALRFLKPVQVVDYSIDFPMADGVRRAVLIIATTDGKVFYTNPEVPAEYLGHFKDSLDSLSKIKVGTST
jgi:hypothetical protein